MSGSVRSYSTLALMGCFIALVAGAAGALAGPAYRWEILGLSDAFTLLRWAGYGGAGAAVLCVLGLIRAYPGGPRKGAVMALAGLVVATAVFWVPYSMQRLARQVPPIHDITTDTDNPPEFRAVAPLRPEGANSLEYADESVASRQRAAYPDIETAETGASPDQAFDAVLGAAHGLGWRIVDESRETGRLEAVDTTFWFGFRDDIVVRVSAAEGGSRIDVRSVSRVGVSDLGKNAERIRAFLDALRARL